MTNGIPQIIVASLGIIVGLLFGIQLNLHNIDQKLGDIRTITSELRDAQNCATWPDDPACK